MKYVYFSLVFTFSFFFTSGILAQDFSDVSAAVGVDGYCGMCGHGSGVSFVDFNGDGYDDLTFATAGGQNVMFYQYNSNSNTFDLIAAPISNTGKNKQVLWVDFDNDGDRDLFIANEDSPNRLYENNGSFVFTDITVAVGLPLNNDPSYGTVFGDYNNDGLLDIYVGNRSIFQTHTNYLYRNNGNGSFSDVTTSTGTGDAYNYTFCSAFLDINDDGYQDIYNSQDKVDKLNTMFKNNGDDTFSDISSSSNTDLAFDAMNVGVGDYDNDGDLDIYVTNDNTGNALLKNNGDETFSEVAAAAGVAMYKLTWGGNFFDVDNDMDLDLYVSAAGKGPANLYGSELYLNDHATYTFSEANCPGMVGDTINSYANAIGDFNNDGKSDIVVNNSDQVPGDEIAFQIWENTTANSNNWLKVSLIGTDSNRDGIGSWIEVFVDGQKYTRYKHCGVAYLAQNSATELIGLGTHTIADSVRVRWLSGNVDLVYNIAAGSWITIEEGSAPLAVEWLDFDIEGSDNHSILLDWSTISETNNEGFEIQRSDNTQDFRTIAWQVGNQNASSINTYRFEDRNVQSDEVYYYRLKQIDTDGQYSFSKVLSIQLEEEKMEPGFSFYPNPLVGQTVNVSASSAYQLTSFLEIYNLNGQQIATRKLQLEKGISDQKIDLPDLPSGVYFGKLQLKEKVFFSRLIVE